MWRQICTIVCALVYLNNSSESYIITDNTTTGIGLSNFSDHDVEGIKSLQIETDSCRDLHIIDVCSLKTNQECKNNGQTDECVCKDGFKDRNEGVPNNEKDCTMIEECDADSNKKRFCESKGDKMCQKFKSMEICVCKYDFERRYGQDTSLVCTQKRCPQAKIDECTGKPNQECLISRTTGDPECACKIGYEDRGTGGVLDCHKIHVCKAGINPCPNKTTECVEKGDDYYCNCLPDYVLEKGEVTKNKGSCQKKTACNERKDVCPNTTTKCVLKENNDYYCDCLPGHKVPNNILKENNKEACIIEVKNCECQNGDCVQKNGKIECQCWRNYGKLSNTKCIACNCGERSSCIFDWQSHRMKCICNEGFRLIKGTCVVDECASNPCPSPSKICEQNTEDRFDCKCAPGYKRRNFSNDPKEECIVDLCRKYSCPRNSTYCVQIEEQDYFCVCMNGYKLKENAKRESNKEACLADCVPECVYGKCERDYGNMKCRCDEHFEGPACDKMKLIMRGDFVYLIVAGVVCFICVLISIITLVIVCRKFKMIKK